MIPLTDAADTFYYLELCLLAALPALLTFPLTKFLLLTLPSFFSSPHACLAAEGSYHTF